MSNYQKYIVTGHLGRDPETRSTKSEKMMTTFSLATDGARKDGDGKPETLWLDVVAFNKLAEICAEYLKKGAKVLVDGKLNSPRTFERKDGTVGVSLSLQADSVTFLGNRAENGHAGGEGGEAPATDDDTVDIPF